MKNLTPNTYNLKPISKGFTLIEIIIVVAISALLTGVLVTYSQRSRQQIVLNVEKAKVAELINRAKVLTLAGFTDPPTIPPPCAYGFGIDTVGRNYGIFTYDDPNVACEDASTITSIDESFFTYLDPLDPFHRDINIIEDPDPAQVIKYILYIPPELNVLIFDGNGDIKGGGEINFETKDGSFSSSIRISSNGQLSF